MGKPRRGRSGPKSGRIRDANDLLRQYHAEYLERRLLLTAAVKFATEISFPVGADPSSVVTADLNGDGKSDVVVTNYQDNSVSVLLGNGNGTFLPEQRYPTGLGPTAVAVSDVNGDGRPDLVVANFAGNSVSILLGNGNGTFQSQQTFAVGAGPDSLALSDFNLDNRTDLAVANAFDGTISLLLGNGNGSFQSQQTFAAGASPGSLAAADINGDGRSDLLLDNSAGATVSILLGNGDGTFQARQTIAAGNDPGSLVLADFNGDKRIDLAVSNHVGLSNTVSILLGNGNGTFQACHTFATGNFAPSILATDLNGDGHLDLAVSNDYAKTIGVMVGNGDGSFQSEQTFAIAANPGTLAAADFDGDGAPDLALVHSYSHTVGILLNRSVSPEVLSINLGPSLSFKSGGATATFNVTFSQPVTGVAPADFQVPVDGATYSSVSVTPVSGSMYTVTVSGIFVTSISGRGTVGLNLVDNGTIRDYGGLPLAGGSVTFQAPLTFNAGAHPSAIAVADVNGDGHPDLIVTNKYSQSVSVFLGNGDGSFQAPLSFTVGNYPDSVAVADLNGDGRPDLVVGNAGKYAWGVPGSVSVLMGNGNGTFQNQITFAGKDYPQSIQVADVNGDGKPDIIIGDEYGHQAVPVGTYPAFRVTALLGNGNGTFQSEQTLALNTRSTPIVVDVNGDGMPDLVFGYNRANGFASYADVSVRLNLGKDNFQTWSEGLGESVATPAVAVGDFNGDGKPDLVATLPGHLDLMLGNGDGTFQYPVQYSLSSDGGLQAASDLNNDGNIDLLVPNLGVLLGNGNGTFRSQQTFSLPGLGQLADLNGDGRADYIGVYPDGRAAVFMGNPVGSFTGQAWSILPPPAVTSISRYYPSAEVTSSTLLIYTVTFNSFVNWPSNGDFRLITTGDVSAASPVVESGGDTSSGSFFNIYVDNVHGSGSIQLELVDYDDIYNGQMRPLGDVGLFNGSFVGPVYTILQPFATGPTVVSINRASLASSTVDSTVSFTVTFSEAVTGVNPSDFTLSLVGVTAATPMSVAGSGAVYTVTVSGITGAGTIGLNLVASGSIRDQSGNELQNGDGGPISFQAQQTFASGPARNSITAGEVNGDGKPDLIVTSDPAGAVSVLLGNGNGTFPAAQSFAAGANPYDAVLADVNGDGNADLIVANDTANGTVSILFGNGDGTFTAPSVFAAGSSPQSVATADLNGDGKLDLVVGSSDSIGVLLGNGNGTFQAQQTVEAGGPFIVAVADVNGDGIPDIIAANRSDNSVSILLGNGDGTFQSPQTLAVGTSGRFIASADVNGDGKFDLIVSEAGSVGILIGNGNGTFQPPQTVATGAETYGLVASDVNGDGKLDLLLTSKSGDDLIILNGNGDGTFQAPLTFAMGASPVALVGSDFNGDGRIDLASLDGADGSISVLLAPAASFAGQAYTIVPPAESITGTSGNDTITLTRDADGTDIDWSLSSTTGSASGMLPVNDPNGLTINGNGGNDTISLINVNPLPPVLHLNGTFIVYGMQGISLSGTTLDIGKSTIYISYVSAASDPIAAIMNHLRTGYNNGAWDGSGIDSAAAAANPNQTTGIGYADWADGQGADTMPNTIELKYTLYGDANLDGQVNSADLQILLFGLNRPGAWDQGDFNYDGQVNSADLQGLLFTLNTSLGNQATPVAVAAASAKNDLSPQVAPTPPVGSVSTVIHHPSWTKPSRGKRR